MSDAVLVGESLRRVYGRGQTEVVALADASLELHPGELVVLRGPSGSGKTTLLTILGGLDRPSDGRVILHGRDLTTASESELVETRRRELGFVFQSFALLPMLSAAENIEVPLRLLATPSRERDDRVRELLALVGLADHAQQRPFELSGGQQQRVGLARALANRPPVLIADEPTGQLDSGTAVQMMELIVSLVRGQGVAALVSTHDPRMAEYADRVIELRDGRLVQTHGRHAAPARPEDEEAGRVESEAMNDTESTPHRHGTDDTIQPAFDDTGSPADAPVGGEQRVSDPDDETTRPDVLISAEGPDVETSERDAAPDASTDPLDPTPVPDPDLEAPAQEDGTP